MIKKTSHIIGICGLILLVFTVKSAQAYVDPGTGSYFFQLLIAGLLGGIFAIKSNWRAVKNFFVKIFSGKKYD